MQNTSNSESTIPKTRLDVPETRLEADVPPTRLDGASSSGNRSRQEGGLIRLPSALADAGWEIVEHLPAQGAEAELFVVGNQAGEQRIAKVYRRGIKPPDEAIYKEYATLDERYVIRLDSHEISDDCAYELMEYAQEGSLRKLLSPGVPLPVEKVESILTQLHKALEHLHQHNILHRDVKPDNILLRSLNPLQIVLADFGLARIVDGSIHFTRADRTVRYASPEASSGGFHKTSDYWSVGMILLEALTGTHPFARMSDEVITHELSTKSVDVGIVGDKRWQTLCRGLLIRDPKKRWGSEQVGKWLARGNPPVEEDHYVARGAREERPYSIEGEECWTKEELARALVRHWDVGIRHLKRGTIRRWFEEVCRNYDLANFSQDMMEKKVTDDIKMIRLIRRLDPEMPPAWRQYSLDRESLAQLAAKAVAGDKKAGEDVLTLYDQKILQEFA